MAFIPTAVHLAQRSLRLKPFLGFLLGLFLPACSLYAATTIQVEYYQVGENAGKISGYTLQLGQLSADGSFQPTGSPTVLGYSTGSQSDELAAALVGKYVSTASAFDKAGAAFKRGDRFKEPSRLADRFEVITSPKKVGDDDDDVDGIIKQSLASSSKKDDAVRQKMAAASAAASTDLKQAESARQGFVADAKELSDEQKATILRQQLLLAANAASQIAPAKGGVTAKQGADDAKYTVRCLDFVPITQPIPKGSDPTRDGYKRWDVVQSTFVKDGITYYYEISTAYPLTRAQAESQVELSQKYLPRELRDQARIISGGSTAMNSTAFASSTPTSPPPVSSQQQAINDRADAQKNQSVLDDLNQFYQGADTKDANALAQKSTGSVLSGLAKGQTVSGDQVKDSVVDAGKDFAIDSTKDALTSSARDSLARATYGKNYNDLDLSEKAWTDFEEISRDAVTDGIKGGKAMGTAMKNRLNTIFGNLTSYVNDNINSRMIKLMGPLN